LLAEAIERSRTSPHSLHRPDVADRTSYPHAGQRTAAASHDPVAAESISFPASSLDIVVLTPPATALVLSYFRRVVGDGG
jgi:hypothetical protein